MKILKIKILPVLSLAVVALPSLLSAAFLNGNFGQAPVSGTDGIIAFEIGGVGLIDFCPENTGSPSAAGCTTNGSAGNTGSFSVTGQTGLPAAISGTGSILDLAQGANTLGFTVVPFGPGNTPNFLSIGGFNFVETNFLPESCTPSTTQLCIGGFQFGQAGSNVTVTVVLSGTVANTDGTGNISNWTDVITGQYNSTTIANVFAAATSTTGIDTNAWSGSVAIVGAAVPEPGTLGLVIGGSLLGLAGLLGRRAKAKKV